MVQVYICLIENEDKQSGCLVAKEMAVDKVPVELRDAVNTAWQNRKVSEPELKKWQVYLELASKVKGVKNASKTV